MFVIGLGEVSLLSIDISDEIDGGVPDGIFNGTTIKVDREKNVLAIDRQVSPLQTEHYEFSLEGWTGRFGTPLEFLLALHFFIIEEF